MPDRFRKLEKKEYDAIVVGSGMGGLTCAALLAQKGYSILVLDQHYVAGGNATIFRRRDYEFDIGLHYIGECAPGDFIPSLLEVAGTKEVTFRELDSSGFETYHFPDFQFRVPKSLSEFQKRLVEKFPDEKKGIARYIKFLQQTWRLIQIDEAGWKEKLFTMPTCWLPLMNLQSTLKQFLDTCTKNPQLRAVLAGQHGTYTQPPSRVPALLHAGVAMHYCHGAYYPEGGGQKISDVLAESIEEKGGKILLRARVHKILVEKGKVQGVELENRHVGRIVAKAPIVISNADLKKTLLELVQPEHLKKSTLEKTKAYEMSPPLGVVYLGIQRDLRKEGHANSNYLLFPEYDFEPMYKAVQEGKFYEKPMCYIACTTLKDPENPRIAPPGITNLQLMTCVPSQPESWGVTEKEIADGSYSKNPVYLERKKSFAQQLISQAEKIFPGLQSQIVYQEEATPMTHSRYTNSSGGTSYGIALIPQQFLFNRPGPSTEITGLYLCGASLRTAHGIAGTMHSGVHAAAQILGKGIFREIRNCSFRRLSQVPPKGHEALTV